MSYQKTLDVSKPAGENKINPTETCQRVGSVNWTNLFESSATDVCMQSLEKEWEFEAIKQ